ncbi:MAG: head-tail connector protein [Pseudomonadota bacterium]|jgi:uncharacterized phiE125 gp8 family phage protein
MKFSLDLITAPAVEPVSLDEAKAHCRVTASTDDTYITALVKAARRMCERGTGRLLVTQTWDVVLDRFPSGPTWKLPVSPVQSITHIKYYDGAGTQQTWSSAQYQLLKSSHAPSIALLPGYSWPSVQIDRAMPIEIRCVCGYGLAPAVPEDLKQWILVMVSGLYEKREPVQEGSLSEVKFLDGLLDGESVSGVG